MNSIEKKEDFKVSNKQKMVDGKAAVSRITQSKARIVKHNGVFLHEFSFRLLVRSSEHNDRVVFGLP